MIDQDSFYTSNVNGQALNEQISIFCTALVLSGLLALPTSIDAQLQLNPPANTNAMTRLAGTDRQPLDDDGLVSVLESDSVPSLDPSLATSDQFDVAPELNRVLTQIVLNNMPHEYVSEKKWGNQEKRWDGISLRRDHPGGRLETKRKYKMVNHGTWRKYSAQLADPANQFSVELSDVKRSSDGQTRFWVNFDAGLNLDARQSKWVKGVQLYSFSAEGTAKVRLSVLCDLDIGTDFSRFPPDLVLQPVVKDAKIHVDDFSLRRVSKAGGEIAQQVARRARKELEEKITEKERKLVKKINEEIEENRDDLRISAADAIKLDWFSKHKAVLPQQVQQALAK